MYLCNTLYSVKMGGGRYPNFSPPDLKRDTFVKHKTFWLSFFEEEEFSYLDLINPVFRANGLGKSLPA